MSSTVFRTIRPSRRRGRRLGFLLILLLAAVAGLGLLVFERQPRVAATTPPDAETAAESRELLKRLQLFVGSGDDRAEGFDVTEDMLNALLVSGQRMVPGVAARARIEDRRLVLDMSAGPPWLPRGWWLNPHLEIASSESGIAVAAARVGRLPLPPGLVVPAARVFGDLALGDRLASSALAGIASVRVADGSVTTVLAHGGAEKSALVDRMRAALRTAAGVADGQPVYSQMWALDRAAEAGRLPREGSILPYVTEVVEGAMGQTRGADDHERLRGGLLALALACGDADLGPALGIGAGIDGSPTAKGCAATTLAGRDDLKRHFLVSAALLAASTRAAATGIGEIKELLDSNPGGSGFSFDDLAANAAGRRFAATFLGAPASDWPALLARMRGEADFMPALDGLPHGMSEADFRGIYGDVESPAYQGLAAEIERRVDALPLYAGR